MMWGHHQFFIIFLRFTYFLWYFCLLILLCRCYFVFKFSLLFALPLTELRVLIYFVPLNLCSYQFNPAYFQTAVTSQILLKALTNLPHTDFTLCKCMIDQTHVSFCCSLNRHICCPFFCFI